MPYSVLVSFTVSLVHGQCCITFQAGLLTSGSSYTLRLPDTYVRGTCISDFVAAFVPGYSGGPVPDLHRIPF